MTSHTLLLKHADLLCTMADASAEQPAGIEIRDAGLYARDGVIEQVGPTASLPDAADQIIDMTGHVVIPGMVNTHHHLFQNLTRVVPPAKGARTHTWTAGLTCTVSRNKHSMRCSTPSLQLTTS